MTRFLPDYGKDQPDLPVYKMPHLRGWAVAGRRAYLPAIGRHEVLVVDTESWQEVGRIPVAGQPVFVMAQPDGRQVWVNFAIWAATAAMTLGWQCPVFTTAIPAAKSM